MSCRQDPTLSKCTWKYSKESQRNTVEEPDIIGIISKIIAKKTVDLWARLRLRAAKE